MADTLELECDGSPDATWIERRLREDVHACAQYSYDYERGFKFFGGWQYYNDAHEKLSTSGLPPNMI